MKNKISNYKLSCMSHFCDGTVVDMTKMFTDLNDDKTYDLLWKRLFHISVYDLSTNKAIWKNLNNELQTRNNKGLIEFINCTLQIVPNAFKKGVASHGFGEVAEQHAYRLSCMV